MKLEPGLRVVDIGCGWGSWARYAAQNYGVEVVGITISREQVKEARRRTIDLPVEIRLQDYRKLEETFDRIVSIGMFEHVGYKNYETFMNIVHQCLPEDGLALLHTIGSLQSSRTGDPWMNKYIFPNGMLPSARQITAAAEGRLVMEDWHNFGTDYDPTLMAWHQNFTCHWEELKADYSERFYRMWTYNLLMNAGAFRARRNQLWQIVYSKNGQRGGYVSVR
jgi:cyclopropane-fatty-acyl-phospholipid synthase